MEKPVRSVHFVARRAENTEKLKPIGDDLYQSGNWRVSARKADSLKGAEIHLHERQKARSWAAGRIKDWKWSPAEPSRIILIFKRDDSLCRHELLGWGSGREKKYVLSE